MPTITHRFTGPLLLAGLLVLSPSLTLPPPAAAQGVEFWNKECRKLLKQYEGKARHKAFAASNMASRNNMSQACGIAWGAGSVKQAEDGAVKACKSQHAGSCWVTRSE